MNTLRIWMLKKLGYRRYVSFWNPEGPGDEFRAVSEERFLYDQVMQDLIMQHEWIWQWAKTAQDAVAHHDDAYEAWQKNPNLETYGPF